MKTCAGAPPRCARRPTRAGRPLGLLFDLQGPKLRLSGDVEPRAVAVGEQVTFSATGTAAATVMVEFDKFAALVTERSQIVIGDGVPRFAVERDRRRGRGRPRRLPRPARRRARAST